MKVLYLKIVKPFYFLVLLKFTSKTKDFPYVHPEVYDLSQLINHSRNVNTKKKMSLKLSSKDELTKIINSNGINSWEGLIDFVKHLPYGRNLNKADFKLVITEKKEL